MVAGKTPFKLFIQKPKSVEKKAKDKPRQAIHKYQTNWATNKLKIAIHDPKLVPEDDEEDEEEEEDVGDGDGDNEGSPWTE